MMKEIPINLEVLGRMYGLDHLCGAFVDFEGNQLLLTGYRQETDVPPYIDDPAYFRGDEVGNPTVQSQSEARGV